MKKGYSFLLKPNAKKLNIIDTFEKIHNKRVMRYSVHLKVQKFKSLFLYSGTLFIFLFSIFLFLNIQLMAQGVISIAPKRVVFDAQKRIIDVVLTNEGKDSANYTISFMQLKMTDDGKLEEINNPDPGQKFADKNIRFYPHSVRLGPNESQAVKLQLTKVDQLEPGEYRSHLYFRSMTVQKALGIDNFKKDSSVSLNIAPIFGVTIPVIIRVGESTTMVSISDLKLETENDGTHKLNLILNRTGNMSTYGDITALHIAPNRKETKLALLYGVPIYSPNNIHRIKLNLEVKSDIDISKGIIRVIYSSQSETRPQKLAEAELVL